MVFINNTHFPSLLSHKIGRFAPFFRKSALYPYFTSPLTFSFAMILLTIAKEL